MSAPPSAPRARDEANDATKGLLIALVALGHCAAAQRVWPWLHAGGLYDFHVLAFLLLPFLRPASACSTRVFADRAVRYLVPFGVFALLSAAVWHATLHPSVRWYALPLALIRGDVGALAQGVGFTFLWFMPCLLSLTVLRSLFAATRQPVRALLSLALLIVHGLLAGCSLPLPLNPLPALFALPLGWAVGALVPWQRGRWLFLAVAIACGAIAGVTVDHINVASLSLPDWHAPGRLLLHDVYAVAATLAVVHFGSVLARVPGLVPIGRYSLVIYLSHQFVLKFIEFWSQRQPWYAAWAGKIAVAAVAVPLSLLAGWALARLLDRPQIRPWILPQSLRDWPVTARLRRPALDPAQ